MKGIATQTLLLILIGILVVGIMVFLIYKAATTKTLSVYECKAKLIDICRMCSNTGWDKNYCLYPEPYKSVIGPCSNYGELFYWKDNYCCSEDPCDNSCYGGVDCKMKGDCNMLMGTTS